MHWLSKDKTRSLNLDCIQYWEYTPQGNSNMNVAVTKSKIEIYIESDRPYVFTGEEASELYQILVKQNSNVREII